eukprot:109510-Pyramimonas_sp.AAC.1
MCVVDAGAAGARAHSPHASDAARAGVLPPAAPAALLHAHPGGGARAARGQQPPRHHRLAEAHEGRGGRALGGPRGAGIAGARPPPPDASLAGLRPARDWRRRRAVVLGLVCRALTRVRMPLAAGAPSAPGAAPREGPASAAAPELVLARQDAGLPAGAAAEDPARVRGHAGDHRPRTARPLRGRRHGRRGGPRGGAGAAPVWLPGARGVRARRRGPPAGVAAGAGGGDLPRSAPPAGGHPAGVSQGEPPRGGPRRGGGGAQGQGEGGHHGHHRGGRRVGGGAHHRGERAAAAAGAAGGAAVCAQQQPPGADAHAHR